jgi:hypothetical protein
MFKRERYIRTVIILILGFVLLLTSCGRATENNLDGEMVEDQEVLLVDEQAEKVEENQPKINTDNILFWDDFQDGDTRGWEISSGWYTQQDGDKYWFQSVNESAAWIPKGLEWNEDYALKAVYNLQQGALGFSFCATAESRYLAFIDENRMSLIKEVGGEAQVLAQCDTPAFNSLHLITMGKKDNRLQVYVDKELMLSVQDANPLSGGTIALGAKEGSSCTVDNVLVNKILKQLPDTKPVATQYVGEEIFVPQEIGDEVANLPEDSDGFADLPDENAPDEVAAPSVSFSVDGSNHTTISQGNEALVEWQVENASMVVYESNAVDSSGNAMVSPMESTDYTLTVTDLLGRTENYIVTVLIAQEEASGGVDVLVKGVGIEQPYIKGQPLKVSLTIRNRGSADAGSFSVVWYPKSDGVVGLSWDIGRLGAGEQITVLGDYPGYPEAGNYAWQAIADTENEIGDTNTENNSFSDQIHINSGNESADMPDMVLKGVGLTKPYKKGETIPVKVTVKNNGDSAASGFRVEWFADGLGTAALGWDILILAPGIEITLDGVYSGYPESGTYTWTAKVDRMEQIDDSNRGNNTKSNSVVVSD